MKKIGIITAIILAILVVAWILYKSLFFQFSISPSNKVMRAGIKLVLNQGLPS